MVVCIGNPISDIIAIYCLFLILKRKDEVGDFKIINTVTESLIQYHCEMHLLALQNNIF